MKKKNKEKVFEASKIILKTLFGIGVAVTIITLPGLAQVIKMFDSDKRNKYKFTKDLDRLNRQGFVKVYEKKNETVVEITKKGRKRVLKYSFDDLSIKKPKKWDGKWRFIMFDIPENRKKARNAIRLKLKDLGLKNYQKSVFVYPFNFKNEVDFISGYFGVGVFVKYLVAEEIDNEEKYKRLFKL